LPKSGAVDRNYSNRFVGQVLPGQYRTVEHGIQLRAADSWSRHLGRKGQWLRADTILLPEGDSCVVVRHRTRQKAAELRRIPSEGPSLAGFVSPTHASLCE